MSKINLQSFFNLAWLEVILPAGSGQKYPSTMPFGFASFCLNKKTADKFLKEKLRKKFLLHHKNYVSWNAMTPPVMLRLPFTSNKP